MPSEPTPLGANPTWADYMNVLSHPTWADYMNVLSHRVYPKDTMVDHHLLHRNCQCGLLQTFRQTHYHYPSSLVISVISVISMLYSQIFPIYPHKLAYIHLNLLVLSPTLLAFAKTIQVTRRTPQQSDYPSKGGRRKREVGCGRNWEECQNCHGPDMINLLQNCQNVRDLS